MDLQKFYEYEKTNVYNVHFPNKLGYSLDEIKEIFSEFGDVVSVTKAGDDYGFRFVKYRTEEEVQRCVEGLKNHKTIRLLPKKPKQNNDQRNGQRNNNWTNKRESRESKGNWDSWEQKKTDDGEKSHQNNRRRQEAHRDYTNHRSNDATQIEKDAQSQNEKPQQTGVNVRSLNEGKIEDGLNPREDHQEQVNNGEEVASIDSNDVTPVNTLVQPLVPAEANTVSNTAAPLTAPPFAATTTLQTPLFQAVTEGGASSLADAVAGNEPDQTIATPMLTTPLTTTPILTSPMPTTAMPKTPMLTTPIPTTPILTTQMLRTSKPATPMPAAPMPTTPLVAPEIIDEDLPKLVRKRSKSQKPLDVKNAASVSETKQRTTEAQAIVVANVHTDYGVHYILHLFQKQDPICVSPMKIILKQGLRYCIVYVQSPLQASDIEEKFDNYSLCGKELIVLRAQKLAQFADEL